MRGEINMHDLEAEERALKVRLREIRRQKPIRTRGRPRGTKKSEALYIAFALAWIEHKRRHPQLRAFAELHRSFSRAHKLKFVGLKVGAQVSVNTAIRRAEAACEVAKRVHAHMLRRQRYSLLEIDSGSRVTTGQFGFLGIVKVEPIRIK